MNNNKIIFYPTSPEAPSAKFPPVLGKHVVPDWYKDITKFNKSNSPKDANIYNSGTGIDGSAISVKICSPFYDALTSGYFAILSEDIEILINDKGVPDIKWESDEFLFNRLPMVEIPIPEFHHPIAFTYRMSFGVELPKGYSLLVTQPFNRHDLPFTIPSAIVDADTKFFPIDIRLFLKRGFEGKIKKGTPIYQMIPFKRESWEMETDYNEKNIKERFWFHEKRRKYLFAWYHHHAHVKKEFS